VGAQEVKLIPLKANSDGEQQQKRELWDGQQQQ